MLRVGVLVSGGGTNLQALIDKVESGYLPKVQIIKVISSREGAYALERCKKHGIPSVVIPRKHFPDRESFTQALLDEFEKDNIDLVLMLGFLSILSPEFVERYRNRIINVHPSLIPAFCGEGFYGLIPHQKALEYGVKVTGATVHFVDEGTDTGPIILQKAVPVLEDDTPETLQKRVMEEAEWVILPEAVRLYSEGKLKIEGRRVRILE